MQEAMDDTRDNCERLEKLKEDKEFRNLANKMFEIETRTKSENHIGRRGGNDVCCFKQQD